MEDRKGQFDDKDVRKRVQDALQMMLASDVLFDARHVFTPNADVPDDSSLRLVVLPPERFYNKQEARLAFDEVLQYIRNNGNRPRYKSNRLMFLAAAADSTSRMKENIRTSLAWQSIMTNIKDGRLNVDRLQEQQAKREAEIAEEVIPKAVRDCYKWVLCPAFILPTDQTATIEAFSLNTNGSSLSAEIERVCIENELIIKAWSPVHLANCLKEYYWKQDRHSLRAMEFWEDSQKYLYLPRMKNRDVFERTIITGAKTRDYFATADAITAEGKFTGFSFGNALLQVDSTTLIISPDAAAVYEANLRKETDEANAAILKIVRNEESDSKKQENNFTHTDDRDIKIEKGEQTGPSENGSVISPISGKNVGNVTIVEHTSPPATRLMKAFHGSVEVTAQSARFKLSEIADEIIKHLADDPNAMVSVTVEIHADFPHGASEQIKRTVSENSRQLGFTVKEWE